MDPAEGMIATANQRIHAPDYPHPLTYDWTAPDRYNPYRCPKPLPYPV